MQTTKIFIARKFDCVVKELFLWFTDPVLLCKWFGPKHLQTRKVEMNFHVGGYYRIELLKPNGDHFHIEGEYLEIKEPKRLVFSFHYTGLPQPPPDSKVTIFFEEENDKTSQLTLIQEFEVQPKEIENKTHNWEYMFSILQSVLNT